MSLIVSSTTDSQEAVNAAAGIVDAGTVTAPESTTETPAEETPQPVKAPSEEPQEEAAKEPEEEEQPKEPAHKKGGFQRKIERLERTNEYKDQLIEEMRSQLAGRKPAGETKPSERPRAEQFTDYDEYQEKLVDWKLEQRLAEREARERQAAEEWQRQEQSRKLNESWQERLEQTRETVADYDEVLANVENFKLPRYFQDAIMGSEIGPTLAYELAKQPKELQRILRLDPVSAVRELGKLEARYAAQPNSSGSASPVTPSKAPEPIRPVGGGGRTSTKPLDQMDYQDFKRAREQQMARR
jgi:hypothetical protein